MLLSMDNLNTQRKTRQWVSHMQFCVSAIAGMENMILVRWHLRLLCLLSSFMHNFNLLSRNKKFIEAIHFNSALISLAPFPIQLYRKKNDSIYCRMLFFY